MTAQYLSRLVGPSRALWLLVDAEPVDPAQAERLGLADVLCEPDELLATTEEFAARVARQAGRVGLAAAKRAVFSGHELPLSEALERDQAVHWDVMRRGNFRAGVDAFIKQFG